MIDEMQGDAVPVKLWIKTSDVEESAQKQLKNIAALPWVFKHVAVMPDVHAGIGATIGTVIAMKNAVAPSAVGVDIGCGMNAVLTNLTSKDLPKDLSELRHQIERAVPTGFNSHKMGALDNERMSGGPKVIAQGLMDEFPGLTPEVLVHSDKAWTQIGTLGGGESDCPLVE
jgi:tRNA-splicing ligase RtcB